MAVPVNTDRANRKPDALFVRTKYTEGKPLHGYMSGVPYEAYKAAGVMSKYDISKFARKTPYRYFNEEESPQTRANQIGTALRVLIFDAPNFESKYMLLDEIDDRRRPEFKAAAKVMGKDNVFVGKEVKSMRGMKDAIMTNGESLYAFNSNGAELATCFYEHEETGVLLRVKFDKITETEGFIIKPVKSVADADISALMFNASYHIEAAMCIDAHKAITGQDLDAVKFILVEDTHPFQVAVVYFDDVSIEIGRQTYHNTILEYKDALDNKDAIVNNDPASMVSLPEWVMRQYEEELL